MFTYFSSLVIDRENKYCTHTHTHTVHSLDCVPLSNDSAPIKTAPIVKTATNEMGDKVSCSDSNNNNNNDTVHSLTHTHTYTHR